MKINVDHFEDAVMRYGIECEFYGEYRGRGGHDGIAISLDDVSQLFVLGAALAEDEEFKKLARTAPHVDGLGRGVIASWPKRLFDC